VREEAGIEIENIRFLCVSNFQDHAPRHYVDIGLVADYKSGEVQNLEPDKKDSVEWYDLDHVPEPMFGVMKNYFEALKTDKKYFDIEH
jgi:ADP-ribose pyrophosphatase YjhB (NUDIX family)